MAVAKRVQGSASWPRRVSEAVELGGWAAASARAPPRTEHVLADVDADPMVALLGQLLAAEARAASDVEQVRRPCWQAEQLERPLRHLGLNLDDARATVASRPRARRRRSTGIRR